MNIDALSEEEILESGSKALIAALGRGGFVRYLQAITPKSGDFTAERQQRGDTETLNEIHARIIARRAAKAQPTNAL